MEIEATIGVETKQAEQAIEGDEEYLMAEARKLVRAVIAGRDSAGKPEGLFMIKVYFSIPLDSDQLDPDDLLGLG